MNLVGQLIAANRVNLAHPLKSADVVKREQARQRKAEQRNRNRATQLRWDRTLGPMPDHLKEQMLAVKNLFGQSTPDSEEERAPPGMVVAGEDGNWYFNDAVVRQRSQKGGNATAALALKQAILMREKYMDALDDRNKTREIAEKESTSLPTVRSWRKKTAK